jgi:hypothetical protein
MPTDVLRLENIEHEALAELLSRFGLALHQCPTGDPIPGSYWGDDEAGLRANQLYARPDSPLHSILHEAAHYICMDSVTVSGSVRAGPGSSKMPRTRSPG